MPDPRVFLSHSKVDRRWTLCLAAQLRSAGLDVFVDELDIDPGQDWLQRLKVEVDRADWLVFVASPEAVDSEWCRKEVNAFDARMTSSKQSGRIHVMLRAEVELDGFTNLVQRTAGELTADNYDACVRAVVREVGGDDAVARLPANLNNDAWHEAPRLPAPLRRQLVDLIGSILALPMGRLALCAALKLEESTLSEQNLNRTQLANAIVVRWSKNQLPFVAADGLLQQLEQKQLLHDDSLRSRANVLRAAIAAMRATVAEGPSPFAPYLAAVAAECRDLMLERLRPGEWDVAPNADRDEVEQRLLDEVFVELDVRSRAALPFMQDAIGAALQNGLGAERDAVFWLLGRGGAGTDLSLWQLGPGEDPLVILHAGEVPYRSQRWQELAEKYRPNGNGRVVTLLTSPSITLDALVELDSEFHPGLHGRYVVRGHPGTGKSTALRALARRTALRGDGRIPVLVSLPDLARHRRSIQSDLDLRYQSACSVAPVTQELEREGHNLLLLCDGLDEVVDEGHRRWLLDQLKLWAQKWQQARIVVATRKIGYQPFDPRHYTDLDLQELTRDKQRELLRNWVASGREKQRTDELVGRVVRDLDAGGAAFGELREVPLLLTFVAMLYEEHASDPAFRMSGTRAALYDDILGYLVQGRHRRPAVAIEPVDGARAALQRLAFHVTEHEDRDVPRSELENVLRRAWELPDLEGVRQRWQDRDGHPDTLAFLRRLAHITGIVGHVGPDRAETTWRFWHKSLREALAAERMAQLPFAENLRRAAAIGGDGERWAEPIALYLSRAKVEERDVLMLQLKDANPALALRALGSVEGLKPETVLAVLQLGDVDTEERCRQILLLPDRITDPQRAADVLGQLAAGSDDSQVMWHVLEALRLLVAKEPGARSSARHAEGRLFERRDVFGPKIDADALAIPGAAGEGRFWVPVAAGTSFTMGSPDDEVERWDDEGPACPVTIASRFEIAAVPVTNAMWQQFRLTHDAEAARGGPDAPVTKVDWYDATMYCHWLGVRLPSEAEWECAARAGTQTRFSFGDDDEDLGRFGWYEANAEGTPHAVATRLPNPWGLYDVHGNVDEWCRDVWENSYEHAPTDGSARTAEGSASRVVRGGSWYNSARYCRSAFRYVFRPDYRYGYLGFRPARSSPNDFTTSHPEHAGQRLENPLANRPAK